MVDIFEFFIEILFIFKSILGGMCNLNGFLNGFCCFSDEILLYFFKLADDILTREIDLKNILI